VSVSTTILLVLGMPLLVEPTPATTTRLIGLIFPTTVVIVLLTVKMLRQGRPPRFSLRSLLLVFGLAFCLLVLWRDGAAWQPVHQFPGYCPTVVFSPDASLAAAIVNSTDPPIEIREARTGRPLKTVRQPGIKPVTDMAFSPDGKSLLTMIQGTGAFTPTSCSVHLVDWKTGEERRTWSASRAGRISARGDRFFMYTDDTSRAAPAMRVFQVDRDEPLFEVLKPTFWQRPLEDRISSTGRYLLVRDQGDAVQLWDVDARRQGGTLTDRDFGTTNHPYVFSQFSPDDRYLALATKSGVDFWDVERFERIGRWEPALFSVLGAIEWSPSADRIFAMFVENTGPGTGREHSFLVDREGREIAEVNGSCATFSPSGDRIAVKYAGVDILDGQTGSLLTSLESPPQGGHAAVAIPGGYRSISFSPDGEWLLHNGSATVWHRRRNEHWFGVFSLPAFWGVDLFLIALLLPLAGKVPGLGTLLPRRAGSVNSPGEVVVPMTLGQEKGGVATLGGRSLNPA
jgi:WD40 repeat protein